MSYPFTSRHKYTAPTLASAAHVPHLWFGYGSGTNAAYWASWCLKRGIDPASVVPVGKAVLPDMRLAFHYYSGSWDGGALDVVPQLGGIVEGVLCRVTPQGWRALDLKEGVSAGCYQRVVRNAITPDGACVPVVTHEVCPDMRETFIAPASDYLGVCIAGFEKNGLSTAPLRAAAASRYGGALHDLFVYGTLMKGGSNHSLLKDCVQGNGRAGNGRGTLHDLGGYPGLTLIDRIDVHGQLFRLNDLGKALTTLDRLESAELQGAPGGLYRRTILPVRDGDRITQAWAYVMDEDLEAPIIADGSWLHHLARGASL